MLNTNAECKNVCAGPHNIFLLLTTIAETPRKTKKKKYSRKNKCDCQVRKARCVIRGLMIDDWIDDISRRSSSRVFIGELL